MPCQSMRELSASVYRQPQNVRAQPVRKRTGTSSLSSGGVESPWCQRCLLNITAQV
jgi:hypothetical protein